MHFRLCRDRALFTETLDAIKFICKDIWAACWDKQVDNLRTNHRVGRFKYLPFSSLIRNTGRLCPPRQFIQNYLSTLIMARSTGRCEEGESGTFTFYLLSTSFDSVHTIVRLHACRHHQRCTCSPGIQCYGIT